MAEDKDVLKQETTDMQEKISNAEKDLETFQNTAKLLKEKNECLRKNLTSPAGNALNAEKSNLDKQLQMVTTILESKKRRCGSLQKNLMMRQYDLEMVLEEEHMLKTLLGEKRQALDSLKAATQDQEMKINRATTSLQKVNQEIDNDPNLTALREDAQLRLIRDQNKSTVSKIVTVMARHPEIVQIVEHHFQQAGLPMPRLSNQLRRHSAVSRLSMGQSLPSLPGSPLNTGNGGKRRSCSAFSLPAINITMDARDPSCKGADKPKSRQATSTTPRHQTKK